MSVNAEDYINQLKSALMNYENVNKNQQLKIVSQQETIDELNRKINELETVMTDNVQLTNEINKLNDIIREKNQIISEFQHLAQISTLKFESYINSNQQNQIILEKKTKKLDELKSKFNPLSE